MWIRTKKDLNSMNKKVYMKPNIHVVVLGDELLSFTNASVGNAIQVDGKEHFRQETKFDIVEDKLYKTDEEMKFWDDWDNGAD